jgi:hypothetical protein
VRLAKSNAAFLALAFEIACRSAAYPFHTWAAWVTKVLAPLRGTLTSPVFADRVVFAMPILLSVKRSPPTWFRAPFLPSSL